MRVWFKKGIVWLLTVMLVLGAVTGCVTKQEGNFDTVVFQERSAVREETERSEWEDGQETRERPEGEETAEEDILKEKGMPEAPEESEQGQEPDGFKEGGSEISETEFRGSESEDEPAEIMEETAPREDGAYISKDEVASYLHIYGRLPDNYITKKEAQELGWDSKKGNLDEVAPGMSIGGSYFGNYEGLLPKKKGRKYYECDLEYEGGYRGAKRLIYSNDGLIFYTEDHYKTFEQLY